MPTGFDEFSALKNMEGASKGHIIAGGIAGLGRSIRKKAGEKKTDPVVELENQARMAKFKSELKRGEMSHGHELGLERLGAEHYTATELANLKAQHASKHSAQESGQRISEERNRGKVARASEKAKAKYSVQTAQGLADVSSSTAQNFIEQGGGIGNRSFKLNPSTGAVEMGVPVKGIEPSPQMRSYVDLSKYDK